MRDTILITEGDGPVFAFAKETLALQSRIGELTALLLEGKEIISEMTSELERDRAAIAAMSDALTAARDQFLLYEKLHIEKGTLIKAAVNGEYAARCQLALDRASTALATPPAKENDDA